jgi:hypothetical protein
MKHYYTISFESAGPLETNEVGIMPFYLEKSIDKIIDGKIT